MSVENPFQPPEVVAVKAEESLDRDRLRRIALAQRQVNLAVLLYLMLVLINIRFGAVVGDALWASFVVLILALVMLVLGAISVFRLASIFRGQAVAVLYVFAMMIPLLGLLLLLSVSSKATNELRKAGYKVGLLGVNPKTI